MQVDYTSQQAKLETLKQLKHTNETLKAQVSRVSGDAFYSRSVHNRMLKKYQLQEENEKQKSCIEENTNLTEVVSSLMKANKYFRYQIQICFPLFCYSYNHLKGSNKKKMLQSCLMLRTRLPLYRCQWNSILLLFYFHSRPLFI